MTNYAKLAIGVAVLLLLLFLGGVFDDSGDGVATGGSVPVRRGTLTVTLTERGTLKTRNAVHIRS